MPSLAVTAPTSSMVACMADHPADAVSGGPPSRASLGFDAGNSAEHQPPFLPEAPNPAVSCSRTATRRAGSARSR